MKGGISLKGRFQRAWGAYERALERRPVLVQCAQSVVLWGLGDVLAQRVSERRTDLDHRRIAVTAAFGGCLFGPVGHVWYTGLDEVCGRLLRAGSPSFVAAKVLADSFIFGPIYVLAFYAWGCALIDGTGWKGFSEKVAKDFVPTYAAELAIWPLFQAVNFTKIPVEHQLLAVNCATLLDAMFLSWARAQDDWVGTARAALEEMQRPKQQQAQPGATVAVAAATATVVVVSAAGGAGAVAQQQQRRH